MRRRRGRRAGRGLGELRRRPGALRRQHRRAAGAPDDRARDPQPLRSSRPATLRQKEPKRWRSRSTTPATEPLVDAPPTRPSRAGEADRAGPRAGAGRFRPAGDRRRRAADPPRLSPRRVRRDAGRAVPQAGQAAPAGDRRQPARGRPGRGHGAARRAFPRPRGQGADRAGRFLARRQADPAVRAHGPRLHLAARPRGLRPARASARTTAERVLAAWLEANAKPAGPARARRGRSATPATALLGWLVHAPLILSGGDKALRARVLAAIDETARWLDRNVGKRRGPARRARRLVRDRRRRAAAARRQAAPAVRRGRAGRARSASWSATTAACCRAARSRRWRRSRCWSSSRACYRATRRDPPQAVETMLQLLVPPLLALTHGDGGARQLAGRGRGAGRARSPRWSRPAACAPGRCATRASGATSASPRARRVLQFDAAPPPLAAPRAPRLRLDAGVRAVARRRSGWWSTAAARRSPAGQVPVRIEQGLRATAAHSTLVLGDANSTAVLINGKLGAGVGEVEVDRRTLQAERRRQRDPARGEPRRLRRALRPGPPPHPDPARRRHRAARRGPAGARRAQGQARQGGLRDPLPPRPGDRGSAVARTAAARRSRCPTAATGSSSPAPAARSSSTRASGSTATAARSRSSSWSCRAWSRAAAAASPGCSRRWDRVESMTEVTIRRALLSVSDKSGVVELASRLAKGGVELVSTGGTARGAARRRAARCATSPTSPAFPR